MSFIEKIPRSLEPELTQAEGAVQCALGADLTPAGRFGEEWLVITDTRLLVYAANGEGFAIRLDIPLDKIQTPTVDALIGGGALMVTVDNTLHEVIRYTNACQRKFSRVCRYLVELGKYKEAAVKGAAKAKPTIEPDPDERTRCPKCHLLLPEGTGCVRPASIRARRCFALSPICGPIGTRRGWYGS